MNQKEKQEAKKNLSKQLLEAIAVRDNLYYDSYKNNDNNNRYNKAVDKVNMIREQLDKLENKF